MAEREPRGHEAPEDREEEPGAEGGSQSPAAVDRAGSYEGALVR